ncbi:hypothetical protein AMK16_22140 [Streptomyces sp. CB00455]|uniref:Tn3 family transposase n=1 Tax=Streptomyces sp. CB00455 TaxID=1703927 RepID=UPI00096011FC|nr:Tn3 family transposase [Streptomyces sp. CB00455]OKK17518.1 hypothetical protein AMK16_22140 [Streptomyces sp. CB00455]
MEALAHRTVGPGGELVLDVAQPVVVALRCDQGVLADNDPVEQEKAMKFNAPLTNAVIFHNALDIAEIVRQLLEEGREIDPEALAHMPHKGTR